MKNIFVTDQLFKNLSFTNQLGQIKMYVSLIISLSYLLSKFL